MKGSKSSSADLDLERGIPTTVADVEALRRIRWEARSLGTLDLRFLDASRLPFPPMPRRSVFPDAPPFEL